MTHDDKAKLTLEIEVTSYGDLMVAPEMASELLRKLLKQLSSYMSAYGYIVVRKSQVVDLGEEVTIK